MKTLKYGLLVVLLTLISSCQPPVVFSEPQPVDEPKLVAIPKAYQGIYWCETDSISLIIEEQVIATQKKFESQLTLEEVKANPNLSFENATLHSKELNKSFPAKLKGEIITSEITITDTLYASSTQNVLKLYKGHLILSSPIEQGAWGVTIISLKSADALSITKAALPENLDAIERITPVSRVKDLESENIIQIQISPSRAEFNQILSQGLLFDGSCVDFDRIYPISIMPL